MAAPAAFAIQAPGNGQMRLVGGIDPATPPRDAAEQAIATLEYGIHVDLKRTARDRLSTVHATQGSDGDINTASGYHNTGIQTYYERVVEQARIARGIALMHVDQAIAEAAALRAMQELVGAQADTPGIAGDGDLTAAEAVGIAESVFMSTFESLRKILDQLYATIIAAAEARMGKVAPGALQQASPMGWTIDAGKDVAGIGDTDPGLPAK